ncbi:MAG: hypothetical protein JWQ09_4505 [Segetibacter sp.]|nr:hypothetical protein [Segetibacter sp.]
MLPLLKNILFKRQVSGLIVIIILKIVLTTSFAYGQDKQHEVISSSKFYNAINNQVLSLQKKIEKKTLKTLNQLQKQEGKLQKKLSIKDSLAAKALFADNKYKQLAGELKNSVSNNKLEEYIPQLDSLKTSLKFLNETKTITSKLPTGFSDKLKAANTNIEGLESKLQQAANIKSYIKERRQYLKGELEKFGMLKDMEKMNKEAFYYQQQINEYKEILKDPKKIQQRAIAELRKLPAFTEFMKKNSQLAQLFRIPDNYGSPQALAGLQTRASVQSQLQGRFVSTGVNPQQYLQQQMGAAQAELSKLKDKINKAGGGSSDMEMPDFKPNSQKTRSFLKRIEYGANVQSQKTNTFLPVTSDLALTAGYKLNDKSVIGIGASYKLGWGNGWQHIKLSNEGIGLRSYVDMKVKGSIWISGGYEQNYQDAFTKINQLKDLNAWQTSGLIGLTKKYKISKKTNNIQLLWDFLSYQQVPKRQAILFRIGYVLK